MAEEELPRFYTTQQVAEMFGVKVATVREWMRDGLLSAIKSPGGRRWLIAEDELRRFANKRLEKR